MRFKPWPGWWETSTLIHESTQQQIQTKPRKLSFSFLLFRMYFGVQTSHCSCITTHTVCTACSRATSLHETRDLYCWRKCMYMQVSVAKEKPTLSNVGNRKNPLDQLLGLNPGWSGGKPVLYHQSWVDCWTNCMNETMFNKKATHVPRTRHQNCPPLSHTAVCRWFHLAVCWGQCNTDDSLDHNPVSLI